MKEDHGERQEFAALVQAHSRALFRAARFSFSSFAISAQSYPSMGGRFTVTIYSFE